MTREQDLGNEDEPGLDAALSRFVADARADAAADARARERWLRAQAAEAMSLRGLVADLAEVGGPVVVSTVTGRSVRGVVDGVGVDHFWLAAGPSQRVLLPFSAVTALRPEPGTSLDGSREPSDLDHGGGDLRSALAELAEDRPTVTARAVGPGEPLTGELRSVGLDVAVLAVGPRGRDVVYLRLSSLAELSVIVSG
jgi:hypothetical protein